MSSKYTATVCVVCSVEFGASVLRLCNLFFNYFNILPSAGKYLIVILLNCLCLLYLNLQSFHSYASSLFLCLRIIE